MYASRPTTPFIPPHPDASPPGVESARVIPPTPQGYPYPPGAAWAGAGAGAGFGYGAPRPARGRPSVRYDGMPMGGPPFDPSTYFGHPAAAYPAATPAAVSTPGLMTDDLWNRDQPYLTTDYGQPPPPPAALRSSESRSRSRGSHGRWPADWTGPRTPDEAFAMPMAVPVPPAFANQVPQGTPWYDPPGMVGTGYSAFQQPLPHAGYGAHPPAQPMGYPHPRSARATPWHGGGYLPTTPGGASEVLQDPFDRVARPEHDAGMVDTRWFTGSSYGPVLDPLLAGIVKCSFRVNPLLAPPSEDPSRRPYLAWNMLFSSTYAHRSDERANQSWMGGRDAPATHPRLTSLRIISKRFPWFVDVRAHRPSIGVTCGEVIEALSNFLLTRTGAAEYQALSRLEQQRVGESYHHNRSMADDVPGGRLGEGLRRCDFLGQETMWGGMKVDQRYVAERMSLGGRSQREMTGVFVLDCERRLPMTEEERRAEALRGEEDEGFVD